MAAEQSEKRSKSLKNALQGFDKTRLKKTETTVMTIDGRKYVECKDERGHTVVKHVTDGFLGYVGDVRQDLEVAEVLPGLIMGSQDVAHSVEILQKFGVTHILNVATLVENLYPDLFTYKTIEILDWPDQHILPYFEPAFDFINAGRKAGCVLVHCNAGISRSATIVIGYLMKHEGMSMKAAYSHLKQKRSGMCPNAGFAVQLEVYEERLQEAQLSDLPQKSSETEKS